MKRRERTMIAIVIVIVIVIGGMIYYINMTFTASEHE